jgi:Fic family protein
LLDTPVLYLSRYINQYKSDYYRLLQAVRDTGDWEAWLLFMLEGIVQTAIDTTTLVVQIKALMQQTKHHIRNELPKIYSQDLVNNLFRHPYTKIDFVAEELQVTRKTASKYLEALVGLSYLTKYKLGKDNYYLNHALYSLLQNVGIRTGQSI